MLKKLKTKDKKYHVLILGALLYIFFVLFNLTSYYNSDKQKVLRDVWSLRFTEIPISEGVTRSLSAKYISDDKKVIITVNSFSYFTYVDKSFKSLEDINEEFDSLGNRYHDYENIVERVDIMSGEYNHNYDELLRSYEKGKLVKHVDVKKEKKSSLLYYGFVKDKDNLVYKFPNTKRNEQLIVNSKGDMIFKNDVANITLTNTGEISCKSARTSNCSDAKRGFYTNKGKELKEMLFNMYLADRQLVRNTAWTLGTDLTQVNEIIDFDEKPLSSNDIHNDKNTVKNR